MKIDLDLIALSKALIRGKDIPENHKKLAKMVARDIKNHFKKDKWDLDANVYIDELVNLILGYDATSLLNSYLPKNKIAMTIKDNRWMFVLRKEKKNARRKKKS